MAMGNHHVFLVNHRAKWAMALKNLDWSWLPVDPFLFPLNKSSLSTGFPGNPRSPYWCQWNSPPTDGRCRQCRQCQATTGPSSAVSLPPSSAASHWSWLQLKRAGQATGHGGWGEPQGELHSQGYGFIHGSWLSVVDYIWLVIIYIYIMFCMIWFIIYG